MSILKIETCETKLAKVNDKISKFIQEHNIDEIKTNRYIITYYYKLNDSERETYLLSKNVTLDICKTADKLHVKFNRLKKNKEKLEQELRNLKSLVNNNTSPTSVSSPDVNLPPKIAKNPSPTSISATHPFFCQLMITTTMIMVRTNIIRPIKTSHILIVSAKSYSQVLFL